MGIPRSHPPTRLIAAIFSRYDAALDWAVERIGSAWGEVTDLGSRLEFTETKYYEQLMGTGLRKQLLCCRGDFDPARLADCKLDSNAWEEEYAQLCGAPEQRPLNIDPGYVTPMKVVLASTKDRAHRIYLRDGIYAEECLFYKDRAWCGRPWTYPDYLRSEYHTFFSRVRLELHRALTSAEHARTPMNSDDAATEGESL